LLVKTSDTTLQAVLKNGAIEDWKHKMKIVIRRLPPSVKYVNQRLTGQPVVTALWYICMLTIFAALYKLDSGRGVRGECIMYGIITFDAAAIIGLLVVAKDKEGRMWLLEKYDDGDCAPVDNASRIVIRLLPILGLIVMAEYWVLS
jgi:hypothetical protein